MSQRITINGKQYELYSGNATEPNLETFIFKQVPASIPPLRFGDLLVGKKGCYNNYVYVGEGKIVECRVSPSRCFEAYDDRYVDAYCSEIRRDGIVIWKA